MIIVVYRLILAVVWSTVMVVLTVATAAGVERVVVAGV